MAEETHGLRSSNSDPGVRFTPEYVRMARADGSRIRDASGGYSDWGRFISGPGNWLDHTKLGLSWTDALTDDAHTSYVEYQIILQRICSLPYFRIV